MLQAWPKRESLSQMNKGKALFLQFLSNGSLSHCKDGLLKPLAPVTRRLTFLNVLHTLQMLFPVILENTLLPKIAYIQFL